MAAQQAGDAPRARRAQQDVAGIQRELQRLPGGVAAANVVDLPPAVKSQQDATRAGLIKQAESDVTPASDKLARYDNAQQAIGLIDRALQHPGIGTATGMSGTLDPRNYLPGTDAKNFQVMLDQIRGGAFMSAYQSLRGGGAITEKEGEKAQSAIARIDRAQSTEEFQRGLRDYRDVLKRGYERARQQLGIEPDAAEAPAPRGLQRSSAAPAEQPPVARLKAAPSDADLRNTALKYGMTVDQVKQRLGIK
ncbi:hypothetical protein [Variovorax paradoxus]|uniref:hypothetical protein n=1 Tax=Variovorax paradoxus TaxID=34073 RepID=UPI001ABCFB07